MENPEVQYLLLVPNPPQRDPLPKVSNYRVGWDSLEPVIVEVEENHLGLCGFKDEIPKLLHLETSLEGELELWPFDHNVGEVQQVHLRQSPRSEGGPEGSGLLSSTVPTSHLQWIQHALPGDNDLFRLFLYRQRSNQGSHFLSCLPLGQLTTKKTKQSWVYLPQLTRKKS